MNARMRKLSVGPLLAVMLGAALLLSGSEVGADWLFWRRPSALPAPVPLGASLRDWQTAQAAAADIDHFVIYRHEWFQGGTTLGPYGRFHVQQISKRLGSVSYSVLIQVDANEKLNAQRRLEIVNQLLACGIADAPGRVIVGYPQAEGLYGDEAVRIFNQNYPAGPGGGGMGGYGGATLGGGLSSGGLGTSFGSGFGGGFRGY